MAFSLSANTSRRASLRQRAATNPTGMRRASIGASSERLFSRAGLNSQSTISSSGGSSNDKKSTMSALSRACPTSMQNTGDCNIHIIRLGQSLTFESRMCTSKFHIPRTAMCTHTKNISFQFSPCILYLSASCSRPTRGERRRKEYKSCPPSSMQSHNQISSRIAYRWSVFQ